MISDENHDIDLGRAAGCRTILYATAETKDNAGAAWLPGRPGEVLIGS